MHWKNLLMSAASALVILGLSVSVLRAAEEKGAEQTKAGTVKKVDVAAKQVVVMVAREMTFTVTDQTKIQQHGKPAKLEDIKVDHKVSVTYVKMGDKRTARRIVILKDK